MDTLVDLLTSLPYHADKPLIWISGEYVSYTEVYDGVVSLANYLQEAGLGLGDEVLITLSNSIAFPIAFLGVVAVGCTAILADQDAADQVLIGPDGITPAAHIYDHENGARLELSGALGVSLSLHQLPNGEVRCSVSGYLIRKTSQPFFIHQVYRHSERCNQNPCQFYGRDYGPSQIF